MAGHRSPGGERAAWYAEAIATRSVREGGRRARHHAAHRPAPTGPSLRTTVVAGAAAAGAVATGTFTALIPAGSANLASSAVADDGSVTTALSASSATLDVHTSPTQGSGFFSPVMFDTDDDGVEGGDALSGADEHLAKLGKAADLAAKLAEQHKAAAAAAKLDQVIASGGLDGWIAEALRILELPQSLAPSVKKIIMAESGGNPRAINNWDANARRGTPSQGLMQTIPSTFRHYVHPDLADRPITDPVANITAGIRYMIENYGIGTLQAGGRSNHAGDYVGY